MAEPPDLATLAKRYLALWQEHLTASAADPELADSLARSLAAMGALASLWSGAWTEALGRVQARERAAAEREAGQAEAAPRPAAAAAPSPQRDGELVQLRRRLAHLEERLATLEAGPRRRMARARGTARRHRS